MRTPISTAFLGAALLTGLSLGSRLAPAQEGGPRTTPAASEASKRPVLDPRLAAIQGAWSLVRVDGRASKDPAFRSSGMMLLVDGYLSIELHLGMVETSRDRIFESYFQSGVHQVRIDSFGQLVLEGVVGAEVDEEGYLQFERPGERRLYRYELEGDRLTLTNLQRQARLIFQRAQHNPPTRDIFGREVPVEPPADERD